MRFITPKQAKARISELRLKLSAETDPDKRLRLETEIKRLNKSGGAAEARSIYRAKMAELNRSMAGAY